MTSASDSKTKVALSNISVVQGDASVTMVRGKKKFIYDFVVEMDFKLEVAGSASNRYAHIYIHTHSCKHILTYKYNIYTHKQHANFPKKTGRVVESE